MTTMMLMLQLMMKVFWLDVCRNGRGVAAAVGTCNNTFLQFVWLFFRVVNTNSVGGGSFCELDPLITKGTDDTSVPIPVQKRNISM